MRNLKDNFVLQNGVQIPCIGFGTWQAEDGDEAYKAVFKALKTGYRHIDTAFAYKNEESVGKAIKDSAIAREALFITTKLWNNAHGYKETLECFNTSLENLGLEYIDLYLIHWPNPIMVRDCWQEKNVESWKAIEELYLAGKIRAIGVSNFLPHHIEELKKTWHIAPMVNQIRLYPGLDQKETIKYCQEHEILIEAYSPFGTGKIFASPELLLMADKYKKSIAQVCIRWSIQKGYLPLPKSVTPSRIEENLEVFDFTITPEDIRFMDSIPNYCGLTKNPDTITF